MPLAFPTRAALLTWLEHHGIGHVARLAVDAVSDRLDPAIVVGPHARRRLLDVASVEWIARSANWLSPALHEALPDAVGAFLEAERAGVEAARAEVEGRTAAPEHPAAAAVHARLLALRAKMPAHVAPLPLRPDALKVDPALPGFRYVDPRLFEARAPSTGGFVRPEVRLVLTTDEARGECTCSLEPCVHVLAAIDLALAWTRRPPTAAHVAALGALDRPAWEKTLRALGEALTESPATKAGIALSWRVSVNDPVGVEVLPALHKLATRSSGRVSEPGAGGEQLGPGVVVTRMRLLAEHGAKLSPADARIVALLPHDGELASRAVLEALVDHPRVFLQEAPARPVRVERLPVGLVAEARGDTIRVTAGLDGAALPAPLLERVRKARPEDVLFVWDGRVLTLLDVKPELRAMLAVLKREGDIFPPDSRQALLTALTGWAEHVPVAMPRSVLGESIVASPAPIVRLFAGPPLAGRGGADAAGAGADGTAQRLRPVHVELRVRPLPDSATFAPGEGARDVHVRRGEAAFHAVRDLRAEVVAAEALLAALDWTDVVPTDHPFVADFPSAQGALALLAQCAALPVPPAVEWVGAPMRVAGKHSVRSLRINLERKHEWFGVRGGLLVGGERMELARLLDSARRRERYVRVDADTYIELEDALRRHLEVLADHAHIAGDDVIVGPASAAVFHTLERAGADVEADQHWRALVARIEAAGTTDVTLPVGLTAELRPYQREGFVWLARLAAWGAGGVLADDMGLGKTVQSLALLLARAERGPQLVVAPTSVAFNWREEAARFAPSLRVIAYGGAAGEARADTDRPRPSADRAATLAALGPGDVLVVSYGLLVADATRLAGPHFATVIFDEGQNLKNAATRRSHAARALRADVKFALSGTPIENHLGELWSLYAVVFPALLGGWEVFRRRFGLPIEKKIDPEAAPALARVLAPFLLRRTRDQVESELPSRTEVRVPVVMSSAEWQLYEDARLATLSDLETRASKLKEQERRVDILAALTRLRLLASHPRLYDPLSTLPSSKLARLLELVDELVAEGQRALVFSPFTSHLALVREALDARGVSYVYMDGQTPAGARQERVRAFQQGNAPLFLLSLKAGGVGLNLTAASNVIHLDPWWNPAVEDQASDRAHRRGQTRPVTIYRLVVLGTVEEQMLALHADKRALVARVLDGDVDTHTLSTQELVALLSERIAGAPLEPDTRKIAFRS